MFESMKKLLAAGCLVLAAGGSIAHGQNALINPGFEEKCVVAADWTSFGNVENINFFTTSGARAIKLFGPFNGGLGYSGATQRHPASAGQTYRASVFATSPDWDALSPTGTRAFVSVDFLDANGGFLNAFDQISPKLTVSTGGFPVPLETPSFVAPAGTAFVQITLYVEQENQIGGAVWYDDAYLENTANPGVNILTNSSFETAPANCFGSAFVGWVNFGNGGSTPGLNQRTGNEAAKLFGGFNGDPAFSGWFQNVPATPGSRWRASGFARSWENDFTRPGNDTFIQLEFFDASGTVNLVGGQVRSAGHPTFTASTDPGVNDFYEFTTSGAFTAPPDTAFVRLVILQIQAGFAGGATWWDDMVLDETCPADFNGDGQVDFFDFLDFSVAFSTEDLSADFNADFQVDFFDYLDFSAAFSSDCNL
ncbi:MAG: hypothetical protein SFZ23_01315 [Planctomycetota bacterium]|nr:hypothetical protein [Planctomycetota bacterium]